MKRRFLIFLVILPAIALMASKCNEDDPPQAIVTVIDEDGDPVAGATVKVFSNPTYYNNGVGYPSVGYYDPDNKVLYDSKITDGNGQTIHEFKYESIYSVEAWYAIKINWNTWDTIRGEGALILKSDETYQETITLRDI